MSQDNTPDHATSQGGKAAPEAMALLNAYRDSLPAPGPLDRGPSPLYLSLS